MRVGDFPRRDSGWSVILIAYCGILFLMCSHHVYANARKAGREFESGAT